MAPMLAKHKVAELSPFRWLLLWPALSWPVVTLVHHWTDNAKNTLSDSEIRSTPILESAWRIVNKKEQSEITIPGELSAILPSQPLNPQKSSERSRFAGKTILVLTRGTVSVFGPVLSVRCPESVPPETYSSR
jgi:hypothetical protein